MSILKKSRTGQLGQCCGDEAPAGTERAAPPLWKARCFRVTKLCLHRVTVLGKETGRGCEEGQRNPEDTRRPLQPGKSRRRGWVSRNCCHPRGTGADGDSAWGQPWSLLFPKQRLAGVPCPLQREAVSQCVQSGEDLGVPPSCSASLWLQCDPGETQKLLKDSRNAQIVVYWVLGAGVSL